MLELDSAFETC